MPSNQELFSKDLEPITPSVTLILMAFLGCWTEGSRDISHCVA